MVFFKNKNIYKVSLKNQIKLFFKFINNQYSINHVLMACFTYEKKIQKLKELSTETPDKVGEVVGFFELFHPLLMWFQEWILHRRVKTGLPNRMFSRSIPDGSNWYEIFFLYEDEKRIRAKHFLLLLSMTEWGRAPYMVSLYHHLKRAKLRIKWIKT